MFGTNVLRKQDKSDGLVLYVQSIFSTIQGEGPFAGRPAIFLRLSGCNLACTFCDTDFESRRRSMSVTEIVDEIVKLAAVNKTCSTTLVVITGGEPLIQNIVTLVRQLIRGLAFDVQIETAGTVWPQGLEELFDTGDKFTLVCSPKTGKVHKMVETYCRHWKYLIQEDCVSDIDGLPNKSTQVLETDLLLFRPHGLHNTIWLQPCEAYRLERVLIPVNPSAPTDGDLSDQKVTSSARNDEQSHRNIMLARELAMKFNYRLSVQVHKLVGLP